MTLEQARELKWIFDQPHAKLFIEWARTWEGPDQTYSLIVEPVEAEQQVFTDAKKAHWALVEWMAKSAKANDRYFTLAEDGTPIECDFQTWASKWSENAKKTETKITCSPEIEATISFLGHASSAIHMDENVKLWNAQFYSSAKDEHYGGQNFSNFEEAKAFVDAYISRGCPPTA